MDWDKRRQAQARYASWATFFREEEDDSYAPPINDIKLLVEYITCLHRNSPQERRRHIHIPSLISGTIGGILGTLVSLLLLAHNLPH